MPLLGRKPFQPRRLSASVDSDEEVFVVPETNEAVRSYEEFAARYDQLHSPIWSCALTGKPGLTYEAALKSEQAVRAQLKSFPVYFIGPVLQLVQHNSHSLEYILDDAYDLLHTRFAVGEPVEAAMEPKAKKQLEGRIVAVHEPPPTPPKSADVSRDEGNSAIENGVEGASEEKKEVIKIDVDEEEEPNPTYTVEFLGESPVVKHGVDSDDITRLKRAPTRDLIKNLIKESARRVRWSEKNVWVVKEGAELTSRSGEITKKLSSITCRDDWEDGLVRQFSLKSKYPELTFEMVEASLASPGKDRRSGGGNRGRPSLGGRRNSMKQMTLLDMAAGRARKEPQTPTGRGRGKTPSVPSSPVKGSPLKATPQGRPRSPSKSSSNAKATPQQRPRSPSKSSQGKGSAQKHPHSPTKSTSSRKGSTNDAPKRKGRPPGSKNLQKQPGATADAKAKSAATKTLKDMLSGVSSLPKASCTRLLNKAAQTLSTPERNSLPLAERKLVEQKLQEQRRKLAWKLLTPEQKKQRRAEERAKLKEQRRQQKLIEKERNKVIDDELLPAVDLPKLPDLPAVPLPDGISNEVFGDIAMVAEFLYTYHALITPGQSQHITVAMLLDALVSGYDGMDTISEILVSLLKLIAAEQSGHREIGTKLSALPLATQTAPELVRLWLLPNHLLDQVPKTDVKSDNATEGKNATDSKEGCSGKASHRKEKKAKSGKEDEKEEESEKEDSSESADSSEEDMDDKDDEDNEDLSSETITVLTQLCDTEFRDLPPVDKLQVLVALCQKVLCTEAVQEHLHEQRSQFTKLWRQRAEDSKEIKEKAEREKQEKKQKELEKQQKLMAAALEKSKSGGHSTASSSGAATPALGETTPADQNSTEQSPAEKAAMVDKFQRRPATERQMERERLLQMEKERKEREAKELEAARQAEQREARHQKFLADMELCKRAFRQIPLGEDRHRRRCWLFHSTVLPGLYLEDRWQPDYKALSVPVKTCGEVTPTASTEDMAIDHPVDDQKMSSTEEETSATRWRHFESVAQLENFIAALAKRGMREKALKEVLEGQKTSIVSSIKKSVAALQATNELKSSAESEDELKQSFKDDLQEMVEHMYRGGLGGPPNMDVFEARISSASSLQELGELLLEVERLVQPRFMQGVLCPPEVMEKMIAVAVADNKPKPKKVKCCIDQWRSAVKNAGTLSRLHLLQAILDECIQWHKSAENARCKICRKKSDDSNMLLCDECNQGFHLYCLRPALSRIPSGHWACPSCQPLNARRSSRGWSYAEESSDDEEEEDEEAEEEDEEEGSGSSYQTSDSEAASDDEDRDEDDNDSGDQNDDVCFTCNSGGELLMCDFCPRSFHLECHVPPLRRTPRGKFKCCMCKDPKLAIGRTRAKTATLQSRGGTKSAKQKGQKGQKKTKTGRKRVHVAYSDESSDEEVAVAKRGRRQRATIESSSSETSETTPEKSWEDRNGRSSARVKRANSLSSQPPAKRRDSRPASTSDDGSRRGGRGTQDLKVLADLVKEVLHHNSAWPFAAPVSLKEVPDYLEVVEKPMDLGTVRNKLQRIEYDTCSEVLDDVRLVFVNCDKYNQKFSEVAEEGNTLEHFFVKQLRRNLPELSRHYKAVYA